MKKFFFTAIVFIVISCGQTTKDTENKVANNNPNTQINMLEGNSKLTDKKENFLWREDRYNEELKDTFNTIVINNNLIETISEPEKAALGFVSTFVGSECDWDGKASEDFNNLKCKTLTSLNLGYQCSDEHLGFLKKWFRNDSKSLKELENCPTVPYTATNQNTFDYINLNVRDNIIAVEFGASGINLRMGESWSWTETDYFEFQNDNIKLIKKEKTEIDREQFNIGE
jgi:hypothetical protein